MSDALFEDLRKDFVSYSNLQEKLSRAILELDDSAVSDIESEGRALLGRVTPKISLLVKSVQDDRLPLSLTRSKIQSLFQIIEANQILISNNQQALGQWKNELESQLRSEKLSSSKQPSQFLATKKESKNGAKTVSRAADSPLGHKVEADALIWMSGAEDARIGQKFDRLS